MTAPWRPTGLVLRALVEISSRVDGTREEIAWSLAVLTSQRFGWAHRYERPAMQALAVALDGSDDAAAETAARWIVEPDEAQALALAAVQVAS